MDTFIKILQTQILDYSSFLKDYINLLKDQLTNEKNQEKAVQIFKVLIAQSQNIDSKDIEVLKSLVTKTFNEKQKVKLLPILAKMRDPKITEFIFGQCQNLQQDESLQVLQDAIPDLILDENSI